MRLVKRGPARPDLNPIILTQIRVDVFHFIMEAAKETESFLIKIPAVKHAKAQAN